MNRIAFVSLIAAVLTGCASPATGPSFGEYKESIEDVDGNMSRVVLYRPSATKMSSARSARIQIDGESVGHVDHLGYKVLDVKPGSHNVRTDLWDVPGSCSIKFEAAAGRTHYFELMPREESLAAGMLGGVIGQAIEASIVECAGAYAINEKTERTASFALGSLNKSRD